jgi:hypothetical protein
MSENGWSNRAIFEKYLTTHFSVTCNVGITDGQNQDSIPILFDGHRSHINLTLANWAKQHIILFVLPPHTSHLTQPLDGGVFGPLKNINFTTESVPLSNNRIQAVALQNMI